MKISVIGLGFVGFPLYLTLLNSKNSTLKTTGIEDDSIFGKNKVKKILQTKKNYFNNKELDDLYNRHKKKFDISIDNDFSVDNKPKHTNVKTGGLAK